MAGTEFATKSYVDSAGGAPTVAQGFQDWEGSLGEWAFGLTRQGAAAFNVANGGISIRWRPKKARTIRKFNWFVGSTSGGNYDVGIYAADGTRLWSLGSTVTPAGNTSVVSTVPDLAVAANVEYLLVISGDTATTTFVGVATSFNDEHLDAQGNPIARSHTGIFPLPSSFAPGSTPIGRMPKIILREA